MLLVCKLGNAAHSLSCTLFCSCRYEILLCMTPARLAERIGSHMLQYVRCALALHDSPAGFPEPVGFAAVRSPAERPVTMVAFMGVKRVGWILASQLGSRCSRPSTAKTLAWPSMVARAVVMMPAWQVSIRIVGEAPVDMHAH